MTVQTIQLGEHEISVQNGETVLDSLLRNQIEISHSCHQGVCQSCMMRSLDNTPPAAAQHGLLEKQKQQNYFLACLCYPQQTMRIGYCHDKKFITQGTVMDKQSLNSEIISLSLKLDHPMDFYAGQFVNLKRQDGLTRSYSIVNNSIYRDNLNFHIRRLAEGKFSQWVFQELQIGDQLEVSEPQGLCYYQPDDLARNLLLIGTGSGLAPLAGIISEALHHKHKGDIYLYHGSRDINGLYWVDEMTLLAEQHSNFHYQPCISSGEPPSGMARGRANDVAFKQLDKLKNWRVFLCGHPDMVNTSKRHAFLNGAELADIHADAFHVANNSPG